MRIKEIKLYKFSELSEDAKERVISAWHDNDEYFWGDENKESLKAFCDTFNIKVRDWSYGDRASISTPDIRVDHDEILEFTGLRLYKYVANNIEPFIRKGKYIGHINHHVKHKRCKNSTAKNTGNKWASYHSGVLWDYSCIFTGYCMDDELTDPIIAYLKKVPDQYTTLEDLFSECLNQWVYACQADYEAWLSKECIIEDIEANDYEFHEDGSLA